MKKIDFEQHNAEVKEVWDTYHRREPIRVPIIFGINPRYTMFGHEANPRGIEFEEYSNDPQIMMERQLEHQDWVRHNVPQDAEMGLPKNGWNVYVDFQNYYESAWFGCEYTTARSGLVEMRYYPGQVPDVTPLLKDDDKKRMLFDRGIPDPFTGGAMKKNWEFYDYFKKKQEEGYTWKGLPIASVGLTGAGTDGPVSIACNLRGATEFMTDLLADTEYARGLSIVDWRLMIEGRFFQSSINNPEAAQIPFTFAAMPHIISDFFEIRLTYRVSTQAFLLIFLRYEDSLAPMSRYMVVRRL